MFGPLEWEKEIKKKYSEKENLCKLNGKDTKESLNSSLLSINKKQNESYYGNLLIKNLVNNENLFKMLNFYNFKNFDNFSNIKVNSIKKIDYNLNYTKFIFLNKIEYRKSIYEYNKNLKLINDLKVQNKIELYKKFSTFDIRKEKSKLINCNYYNGIYSKICKNIKSPESIKYVMQTYKKKYKRHHRRIEEKVYLNKYFEKYPYRWDNKILTKLSEKLKIPKKSVYKWNWDKINNKLSIN